MGSTRGQQSGVGGCRPWSSAVLLLWLHLLPPVASNSTPLSESKSGEGSPRQEAATCQPLLSPHFSDPRHQSRGAQRGQCGSEGLGSGFQLEWGGRGS